VTWFNGGLFRGVAALALVCLGCMEVQSAAAEARESAVSQRVLLVPSPAPSVQPVSGDLLVPTDAAVRI
jgi:hypothetical protein